MKHAEHDKKIPDRISAPVSGGAEASEGELMSVSELGQTLGLKKTDRYWLVHKNVFESRQYLGKIWVVRKSFENWYANQVKYHKVNGEEPGSELREHSYSARDIAQMLGIHKATAYELIKREKLETFEVDHWRRIPKEAFDKWYSSQSRYTKRTDETAEGDEEQNSKLSPRKGQSGEPSDGTSDETAGSGMTEFLTIGEAVSLAGVSRTTVDRWMREERFSFGKAGGSVRICRREFETWLQEKSKRQE